MLKPGDAKNFAEYASQVFIPRVLMHFRIAVCVDWCGIGTFDDSLKGTTRLRRGKGERRGVVPKGAIPQNWQIFLRAESNKTELFKFLSEALHKSFVEEEKQLVITNEESILSKPPLHDCSALSPCSHEEADCACCSMTMVITI